jgi:hypothetical protein
VFTDAEQLLQAAGKPVISVGDVVTAHLGRVGFSPAVSVVDDRTERAAVEAAVIEDRPAAEQVLEVENPAATVTRELVEALERGLAADGPTLIEVDGEEDLAVLPATLLAPDGATVVYGQPGEGMVAISVEPAARERSRELLTHMDRDEAFWDTVG